MGWFLSLFPIGAISLAPFGIYFRDWRIHHQETVNHEKTHWKQQIEMLIIPFYLWYFIEWFCKTGLYGKRAYYNISFEREAFHNAKNLDYLKTRKKYSWLKYLCSSTG